MMEENSTIFQHLVKVIFVTLEDKYNQNIIITHYFRGETVFKNIVGKIRGKFQGK